MPEAYLHWEVLRLLDFHYPQSPPTTEGSSSNVQDEETPPQSA